MPFDTAKHDRLLRDIWKREFPNEAFELPSSRWTLIGFQGRDPCTDLRGSGIIALHHLQAFLLSSNRAVLYSLLPPTNSPLTEFPLSIASINCTAMLLSHFQLAPQLALAFLPGARVDVSRCNLTGFLSLGDAVADNNLDEDEDEAIAARVRLLERALAVMHERLLLRLAQFWAHMLETNPATTIMDFSVALRRTYAVLKCACSRMGRAPWNLSTLASTFDTCDSKQSPSPDPLFICVVGATSPLCLSYVQVSNVQRNHPGMYGGSHLTLSSML